MKLFSDRLNARVSWYQVDELNSRSGDAGIVAQRASRLDTGTGSFRFTNWATTVATQRLGPDATPAQIEGEVARITQLPDNFPGADATYGATSDSSSKGIEVELNYNPTSEWTIKFTAARQKAVDTNISPSVQRWLDLRLPVWLNATDDAGNPFWTANGTNNPQAGGSRALHPTAPVSGRRGAGSFQRGGSTGLPVGCAPPFIEPLAKRFTADSSPEGYPSTAPASPCWRPSIGAAFPGGLSMVRVAGEAASR